MKKVLYKFHFDCGRSGDLTGLFLAYKEDIDKLIETELEVYFGEVLGKHSEVYGPIEQCDVTLVSEDDNVLSVIKENNLEMGYNPLDYRLLNYDYEANNIVPDPDDGYDDMTVGNVINQLIKQTKQ